MLSEAPCAASSPNNVQRRLLEYFNIYFKCLSLKHTDKHTHIEAEVLMKQVFVVTQTPSHHSFGPRLRRAYTSRGNHSNLACFCQYNKGRANQFWL